MQNFSLGGRWAWLPLLLLVMSLAACAESTNQVGQVATSTPIPTAPAVARERYVVQRGDVIDPLEFTGRWQPRDRLSLAFDVDGTVRRVDVRRDDTVTAGQLLASLDIERLEEQLEDALFRLESLLSGQEDEADSAVAAVESAELSLFNAELALQRYRQTSPSGSVRDSIRAIESAERAVQDAEDAYYNALAGHGAGGPGAVDAAYNAWFSAQRALEDARYGYALAAAGAGESIRGWQQGLIDLENQLTLAQRNLDEARQGVRAPSQDTIRNTQVEIDRLRRDIDRSTLVSTIDGIVLEVAIQPGDAASAFTGVITVGLPEPREVISNLAVGEAQRLSVGLVGTCQVANRPETAVQCAVRRIPSSARDADQTTRIGADMADLAVPDALIEVSMPLQSRENVLWLPPVAIRTFQNTTFVVLDTPDGGRRVNIEIGLRTANRVEIVSGLEEGDVVVGQ